MSLHASLEPGPKYSPQPTYEGVPLLVVLLVLGGHPEVGQLHLAVHRQQNVPGLRGGTKPYIPLPKPCIEPF